MDAESVFDGFDKLSDITMKLHNIRCLEEKIKDNLSRICGNCDKWMKNTCKPEKQHGQFKSYSSIACNDFVICSSSETMALEQQEELKKKQEELSELTKSK